MIQTPDTAHQMLLEGRISRTAYQVYRAIRKQIFKGRITCWLKNETILRLLPEPIHERTLRKAKDQLKAAGLLVVIPSQRPATYKNRQGGQGCNWYRITEPDEKRKRTRLGRQKDGTRPAPKGPPPPAHEGLPIYETTGTERRNVPPTPQIWGEKVDPETAPDRAGIDARQPRPTAAVSEVLDQLKRVGRQHDDAELPAMLMDNLDRMVALYGGAGVVAMYRLWTLPDQKWSAWCASTKGNLGAMLHVKDALIDDCRFPGLRRKHESDFAVNLPFAARSLLGLLAGRPGP